MLYPVFTAAFLLPTYYSVKKFDRDSAQIGFLRFDMGNQMVQKQLHTIDKILEYYSGKHSTQLLEMVYTSITELSDLPNKYTHPRATLVTLKNTFILGSTILTDLAFSKIINDGENLYKAVNLYWNYLLSQVTEHPLTHPLFTAIESRDSNLARYIIDHGSSMDVRDHRDATLLHTAARHELLDMVEFLIKNGSDVNAKDRDGRTPLREAAPFKKSEVFEFLIRNGAEVNAKNCRGETPLHTAVLIESTEMAKILIKNGADINIKDIYGETPLHRAVLLEITEMAKFLIKNGADINIKNKYDKTPLHTAVLGKSTEMVKILVDSGADVNAIIRANDILYPKAENNWTVGEGIKLTYYISSSDTKVEKIIEYGGFAQSLTFNSAGTELVGVAGTALRFGVNYRELHDITRGSGATNQAILENLAQQINEKSTGDYSVRARVVTQYVGGVLKSTLLVAPEKANYSLYFRGDREFSLMIGLHDDKEIKQFQISSSSDVIGRFASLQDLKEQIDSIGISAGILSTYAVGISLTILSSNPLFLENYNKGSGSNFLADILIKNVVGINAKYKDGNTALMVALTERDFDKAKFLIDNEADTNAKSEDGISPLSLVIRMEEHNEVDMVKYLLQNCANANDADSLGQSLLHIAAVRTNLEVIDLLFKYGANPHAKDHAGNIPAQYASNQEVTEYLTQKTEEYDAHIALHKPFESCEPLSRICQANQE